MPGSTWTSQLFVLADFYNVAQADPTFAEDYTANKVKIADTPAAVKGFERLQEALREGVVQRGLRLGDVRGRVGQMLADGEIAQYPMLTFALPGSRRIRGARRTSGFFAQPGRCGDQRNTLWMPQAAYIAATTEHEDGQAFLAFIASVPGTDAETAAVAPAGPYLIEGATLPTTCCRQSTTAGLHRRRQRRAGARVPSPVKGPTSRSSRSRWARVCAAPRTPRRCYDQDVEKEATAARPAGLVTDARRHPETCPGRRPTDERPAIAVARGRPQDRRGKTGPRNHAVSSRSATRHWFYLPAGRLRRHLRDPDGMAFFYSLTRWTLFRPGVHRPRQLPPVLPRTRAHQGPAQHVRLRRRHLWPEGGPRHGTGVLVTSRLNLKGTVRRSCSSRCW